MFRNYLIATLCLPFIALACRHNHSDTAVRANLKTKCALLCELEGLQLENDSVWNAVDTMLDARLPASMDPGERKNLLQLKNAGLISMFKAYRELDLLTQSKVRSAGEADSITAVRMKGLMARIDSIGNTMNTALARIERANQNHYQTLKDLIRNAEAMPCQYSADANPDAHR